MRVRQDGVETRRQVLDAACTVFAENGFRDGTIAEICRRAGANIASVNYHFRSKENLYIEAWTASAREALARYPMNGGVPDSAPAEDRLRGHVASLLHRMLDRGALGRFHLLHMREIAQPTGLVDNIWHNLRKPLRAHMLGILRELLGPHAGETEVARCELSVIGQCRAATPPPGRPSEFSRGDPDNAQIEGWVEHITRFSLAGIAAERARLDGKRRTGRRSNAS